MAHLRVQDYLPSKCSVIFFFTLESKLHDLWSQLPAVWQNQLSEIKDDLSRISSQLDESLALGLVNPQTELIFRALEMKPDDVTVVIIGQDPYPDPELAIGRAFAVPRSVTKLPPSLRNIFAEVASDTGVLSSAEPDLQLWADQGVMLLNRTFTTISGQRNSHVGIGWDAVSREIVRAIRKVNDEVVGVLWGADARALASEFKPQRIVMSAHPSPLSAYRGFMGSKPFTRVNGLLDEVGRQGITW